MHRHIPASSCVLLPALFIALLSAPALAGPDLSACSVRLYEQTLDHFSFSSPPQATFKQRYVVCDRWWSRGGDGSRGPIFFYFGNEADVFLYVNHTGLMWENAAALGAAMVFAEHRYYGQSTPFPDGTPGCLRWLTTDQALADYAQLIRWFKQEHGAQSSAVVGFGGSYGGMLAAWFRMRYPHLIVGAIAASAPIWSFLGLTPPYDPTLFYRIVSDDASAAGGAAAACASNVAAAQRAVYELGAGTTGRALLSSVFSTCQPLQTDDDAAALAQWLADPWATLAMGNFPYPSSYLLNGLYDLPAWPVRAACRSLSTDLSGNITALLEGARAAVSIYYNASATVQCYFNPVPSSSSSSSSSSPPAFPARSLLRLMRPSLALSSLSLGSASQSASCAGNWDWQWCTEMTQPFASGTGGDMFYPPTPFNLSQASQACLQTWGVLPRAHWATLAFGDKDLRSASNIVFTNGVLDPWRAGGVIVSDASALPPSIVSIVIADGAHHLDLMFANELDPPSVREARLRQLQHIITWLAPYSSPSPPPSQCSASAVPVWPWLALALLALQLASLALFKRHMNSLHRGHVTDDSRAPLLV